MRASPESMTATHAVDGHRGLGDVGGKDHFAAQGGLHCPSLFCGRQITVQPQQQELVGLSQRRQCLGGAPDLGSARQEDQHVAVKPFLAQPAHGAGDLIGQRPRVGLGQMLQRDFKQATLAAHQRAVAQKFAHWDAHQRRRHGHQTQVRTLGELQASQQGQSQVTGQMALVKLVKNHHLHPGKLRIAQQTPQQDPSVTKRIRVRGLASSAKRTV